MPADAARTSPMFPTSSGFGCHQRRRSMRGCAFLVLCNDNSRQQGPCIVQRSRGAVQGRMVTPF